MTKISKIILSASFTTVLLVGCGGDGVQDVAKKFRGVWIKDSNTSNVKGCKNGNFSTGDNTSVFHTMTIDASKMIYNTVKYSEMDCPSDSVDTNYTQTFNYKIDPTKSATTKSGTRVYAMDLEYTALSISKGTVTNSNLLQTGTTWHTIIGKNSKNLLIFDGGSNIAERDKFLENNVLKLSDSNDIIIKFIKK